MGLVIHEKFHVDVDGHAIRHYLILLLDHAHMLLPITVAHILTRNRNRGQMVWPKTINHYYCLCVSLIKKVLEKSHVHSICQIQTENTTITLALLRRCYHVEEETIKQEGC